MKKFRFYNTDLNVNNPQDSVWKKKGHPQKCIFIRTTTCRRFNIFAKYNYPLDWKTTTPHPTPHKNIEFLLSGTPALGQLKSNFMRSLKGIREESLLSRWFVIGNPRGLRERGAFSREFSIHLSPKRMAFTTASQNEKLTSSLLTGPVEVGITNDWSTKDKSTLGHSKNHDLCCKLCLFSNTSFRNPWKWR